MNRGIYTAASALRAATMHQTRLSHNIANLQTTGFKQVLTTHQAYQLNPLNEYRGDDSSLENTLGGFEQGLLVPEEIVDFSQGNLIQTERPLDFGLEGDGFFRLQTPDGERYTRDGTFHRDSQGLIVNADGFALLDSDGQPITLPPGEPSVTASGLVLSDEDIVAQIGLSAFDDPEAMIREEGNRFRVEEGSEEAPVTAQIRQGHLETSNVDENSQVLEMMRILRLYEASQRALQVQDSTLNQAIDIGNIR